MYAALVMRVQVVHKLLGKIRDVLQRSIADWTEHTELALALQETPRYPQQLHCRAIIKIHEPRGFERAVPQRRQQQINRKNLV